LNLTRTDDKLGLELDEWFKEINPAALARMMERMLEAQRKDYWDADPARLKQLIEQYIALVNINDLLALNDALEEHVNQLASGYGLAPLQAVAATDNLASASANAPTNAQQGVSGQQLEKQTEQHAQPNDFIYYALGVMLLIMIGGGLWQSRYREKNNAKFIPH